MDWIGNWKIIVFILLYYLKCEGNEVRLRGSSDPHDICRKALWLPVIKTVVIATYSQQSDF